MSETFLQEDDRSAMSEDLLYAAVDFRIDLC